MQLLSLFWQFSVCSIPPISHRLESLDMIASYLRSQNDCILPGLGQHEVQPLTRTVRANLQNSACRLSF
uniref:Uncharacterized protein n=1 Tax=Salix viminalis TaxID=40686 RepID=A0A6N2N4W1_SALVM